MCKVNKVVCEARIVENVTIAPNTYSLLLELECSSGGADARKLAESIQPGQFIELNLRQPDLVLPRPISVFRVFETDECGDVGRELSAESRTAGAQLSESSFVELRYQLMGEGTRRLSEMSTGTTLGVFGPLGNRWPVPTDAKRALLVGGGIGSAPLAMLARELVDSGCEVVMVQGGRSADLLIAADYFEEVCCEHSLATDDGSRGHEGLITRPLQLVLQDVFEGSAANGASSFDVAYICGPEPMQEACAQLTVEAGIPSYVSLERMMACGVGACLTCVVPTAEGLKRVCADGPVFNAEEVDWDEARSSRVH